MNDEDYKELLERLDMADLDGTWMDVSEILEGLDEETKKRPEVLQYVYSSLFDQKLFIEMQLKGISKELSKHNPRPGARLNELLEDWHSRNQFQYIPSDQIDLFNNILSEFDIFIKSEECPENERWSQGVSKALILTLHSLFGQYPDLFNEKIKEVAEYLRDIGYERDGAYLIQMYLEENRVDYESFVNEYESKNP